jgi:hypothetical protein
MELLELSSEDLVERFEDKIEEKHDYLVNEIEELEVAQDETDNNRSP